MNWTQTIKSALDSLIERRTRSLLTMLGILIGIAAVILTVGLGEGAQNKVTNAISSLGTNLLIVTPGSVSTSGVRGGLGSSASLTLADANALNSKVDCPDIAQVSAVLQRGTVLTAGSANWTAPVQGVSPSYLTIRDRQVVSGQAFTQNDVTTHADVALVGSTVAQNLFGLSSPVGQTVDLAGVPFTITGELNTAGASGSTSEDNTVLIPITTAEDLFGATGPYANSVSNILISAKSASSMGAAYEEANSLLLQRHGITNPAAADFTITPQTSLLSTASSVSKALTVLLVGIAAIALIVGGIGVMNIMLVSVTERIREIGLRKALGATPGVILRQFLIEATALGIMGGIFGVAVGVIGDLVLPHFISQPIAISSLAIVGSVVVAAGIGLIFGVYPASRAARLSPIDALRSE
ncbi:MAG: ABC transporter permease [Actinomycetota bacterium]|jgi:putative ABC transport system permease protein|nr:ABC transporter permease [Actinomycetota bacterium]